MRVCSERPQCLRSTPSWDMRRAGRTRPSLEKIKTGSKVTWKVDDCWSHAHFVIWWLQSILISDVMICIRFTTAMVTGWCHTATSLVTAAKGLSGLSTTMTMTMMTLTLTPTLTLTMTLTLTRMRMMRMRMMMMIIIIMMMMTMTMTRTRTRTRMRMTMTILYDIQWW